MAEKAKKRTSYFLQYLSTQMDSQADSNCFQLQQCVLGCKKALFCHCVLPLKSYCFGLQHPKVTDELAELFEGPLTENEFHQVIIFDYAKNKTPGSDGLMIILSIFLGINQDVACTLFKWRFWTKLIIKHPKTSHNQIIIPGGPKKRNSRYSRFFRILLWSTVIFSHLAG